MTTRIHDVVNPYAMRAYDSTEIEDDENWDTDDLAKAQGTT